MSQIPAPQIAIIGATGVVGGEMLVELNEAEGFFQQHFSSLPTIGLFASERSAGQSLKIFGHETVVQPFTVAALKGYDFALMSAGGEFSKKYAPELTAMGIIVIDNSSAWRSDPNVPLVVPEVNKSDLKELAGWFQRKHTSPSIATSQGAIIANPNCSTIQLMVAVAPLEQAFGLNNLVVATYQSVSGAGMGGMSTLAAEHDYESVMSKKSAHKHRPFFRSLIEAETHDPPVFDAPIFCNAIPTIGTLDADGHSTEELKMIAESRRILSREDLSVLATAVRVSVYVSHCIAVNCQLKNKVTLPQVNEVLRNAPGLVIHDDPDDPLTPISAMGKRESFISRIRLGPTDTHKSSDWVQLWNVADNLKKGAATNAFQILYSILTGNNNG